MFCPKCGTKNPDNGKFCRKCGTDLENVSAVLSSSGVPEQYHSGATYIEHETKRRNDPAEVYGDSIKHILLGIGFLAVSVVLFMTNVAGGAFWWWAMLFPGFVLLSKGISDYMKSKRLEQRQLKYVPEPQQATLNQPDQNSALPASNTDYIPAKDSENYQTGNLVPASVVENTTRHLEMDKEGKTMTLPKK